MPHHQLRWLMLIPLPGLLAAATSKPASQPSAELPPPTRVTLHLRDADPQAAFADLFAQAHVSMQDMELTGLARSPQQRVTLEVENRPFLEALLALCRLTAMEPNEGSMSASGIGLNSRMARGPLVPPPGPWPDFPRRRRRTTTTRTATTAPATTRALAATTTLTTRPSWVDLPAVTVGPFVFVPRDIERRRWKDLGGGDGGEFTSLVVITLLDPNVRLHAVATSLEVLEATDEHGQSLLPPTPSSSEIQTRWDSGNWMWTSGARLAYPPPGSHTIATLKLLLRGSIVTRTEKVEFADLNHVDGSIQAIHGMRYRIDRPQGNERGYLITLTIYRDGRNEEEWKELRSLVADERSMHITDERKERVFVISHTIELPGHQGMVAELRVSPTSQPTTDKASTRRFAATRPMRMVWTLPIEVNDVAVPVEFHNLPLP